MKHGFGVAVAIATALLPAPAAFAEETYLACAFAQPPGAPLDGFCAPKSMGCVTRSSPR